MTIKKKIASPYVKKAHLTPVSRELKDWDIFYNQPQSKLNLFLLFNYENMDFVFDFFSMVKKITEVHTHF